MGIFIKSGILHTLKFHLHTLSRHFWLNLCAQATILCKVFKNYNFKITATSLRGQWVKRCYSKDPIVCCFRLWPVCGGFLHEWLWDWEQWHGPLSDVVTGSCKSTGQVSMMGSHQGQVDLISSTVTALIGWGLFVEHPKIMYIWIILSIWLMLWKLQLGKDYMLHRYQFWLFSRIVV